MTAIGKLAKEALDHALPRSQEKDLARGTLSLLDAAKALYEEVEMAESIGICLPDRVPSLTLRDIIAGVEK